MLTCLEMAKGRTVETGMWSFRPGSCLNGFRTGEAPQPGHRDVDGRPEAGFSLLQEETGKLDVMLKKYRRQL